MFSTLSTAFPQGQKTEIRIAYANASHKQVVYKLSMPGISSSPTLLYPWEYKIEKAFYEAYVSAAIVIWLLVCLGSKD